ncbi:hypothetical protein [Streptomyces sp. NPDC056361]|uniref:hypothetical protein n=1 Tax=Streptomyces sp. NPDC056361 TaxID=3345795 RepID=UPI0035DEE71C
MYNFLHDALANFLGGITAAACAATATWAYHRVKAARRMTRPGDPTTAPEPTAPTGRSGGHGTD